MQGCVRGWGQEKGFVSIQSGTSLIRPELPKAPRKAGVGWRQRVWRCLQWFHGGGEGSEVYAEGRAHRYWWLGGGVRKPGSPQCQLGGTWTAPFH